MIDIYEPHPNLVCEICDDNNHCLPRWEDDGGGTARLPPPAQRSRRTPRTTMNAMIGHPKGSVINRLEDLTAGGGAGRAGWFALPVSRAVTLRLRLS